MPSWLLDTSQVLANISTALGIPFAIYLFYQDRRREKREREYTVYNDLDIAYIEYLKLCLENPDLDVFDISVEDCEKVIPGQKRKEIIMFAILFSILERAFLMYEDASTEIKIRRHAQWERYILHDWLPRDNFHKAWELHGASYHISFVRYMNGLIKKYEQDHEVLVKK